MKVWVLQWSAMVVPAGEISAFLYARLEVSGRIGSRRSLECTDRLWHWDRMIRERGLAMMLR